MARSLLRPVRCRRSGWRVTRPDATAAATASRLAGAPRSWLTVADCLAELGVDRSTWEKWRQRGVAPRAVRLPNGQLRIRRDWLERWLAELTETI
ncbi:MAG: helix-turn-helix transcriptional regulator [Mycobacteriales bacterium]